MIIYNSLTDKKIKPVSRSIAIGVFDGVHLGHQKILKKMLLDAKKWRCRSMVITFDPHPSTVLNPGHVHALTMSLEHRLKLLGQMKVDEVLVIKFNQQIAKITHEKFFQILLNRFGLKSISIGHDFRFGKKGLGDINFFENQRRKKALRLYVTKAITKNKKIISSTYIRNLISGGNIKEASQMLGRPFSIQGTVIQGKGRGKKMGFPTANIDPHHEALPPNGVYAVWGIVGARRLKGVLHIGERPTFGEIEKSIEVHFLKFNQEIYGQDVELVFVRKIRQIKPFKSPGELTQAIQNDIKIALHSLGLPL